ncbi:hypothetical protein KEJ21_00405 [Candidatus Bathyarchaeota archaeon]|nr:hypothetical protein [Candidatus Bathyarchaeota archaeon]MBS7630022.1 hypothetical protein [Candidatus Bathyarchaeota archaeon]
MSNKIEKYGPIEAIYLIVALLIVFAMIFLEFSYPAFEFVSSRLPRILIPLEPFNDIANKASRFLWEHRALDLTIQAFVIFTAVICCLALLKPDEREEEEI